MFGNVRRLKGCGAEDYVVEACKAFNSAVERLDEGDGFAVTLLVEDEDFGTGFAG